MLIILISIVVFAVIFYFLDYINRVEECECQHLNFARYDSKKELVCIDCGFKKSLSETIYPKHQR